MNSNSGQTRDWAAVRRYPSGGRRDVHTEMKGHWPVLTTSPQNRTFRELKRGPGTRDIFPIMAAAGLVVDLATFDRKATIPCEARFSFSSRKSVSRCPGGQISYSPSSLRCLPSSLASRLGCPRGAPISPADDRLTHPKHVLSGLDCLPMQSTRQSWPSPTQEQGQCECGQPCR